VGARVSGPGVHTEHLCEEPTVLVMRRKHPGSSVRLGRERLEELGHVAVELAPGRGIRDPVSAAYARAGAAGAGGSCGICVPPGRVCIQIACD
jgi:hypothetical protein